MRLVEIYQVDKLSPTCPPFVESFIHLTDAEFYLLEINPNHPVVKDLRSRGIKLVDDLKRRKFRRVRYIWQGRIDGHLLDSAFLEQTYYCELCNEIHGLDDESAYQEFSQIPASNALAEMFSKYGVLTRRPRLPGKTKR